MFFHVDDVNVDVRSATKHSFTRQERSRFVASFLEISCNQKSASPRIDNALHFSISSYLWFPWFYIFRTESLVKLAQ